MTLDIDIYGEIKMKEEHRNKIIVDIGGNSDERYGYNYKNKELFIKSNKKITGMGIVTFCNLIISFSVFYGKFCRKPFSQDFSCKMGNFDDDYFLNFIFCYSMVELISFRKNLLIIEILKK